MVCIGEYTQCPQCTRMGRIVWVSTNGQTVGIKCPASHRIENLPDSHGFTRAQYLKRTRIAYS